MAKHTPIFALGEIITQIEVIDRQIDANRNAMIHRLHFNPDMSAAQWQRAWDRCPDLYARDRALFLQRGLLQEQRDAQAHREWQTQQRRDHAARRKHSVSLRPLDSESTPSTSHPSVLRPELNARARVATAEGQIQ